MIALAFQILAAMLAGAGGLIGVLALAHADTDMGRPRPSRRASRAPQDEAGANRVIIDQVLAAVLLIAVAAVIAEAARAMP